MTDIGIGDPGAWIRVHCPNRPPMPEYGRRTTLLPAAPGELDTLVAVTGNHWRKIVNLYAKLIHALDPQYGRWQDDRDNRLLQAGSGTALLFSEPAPLDQALTLVMGKTYAQACGLTEDRIPDLMPDPEGIRVSPSQRLILTPYFDYRQLSNARLAALATLIQATVPDPRPMRTKLVRGHDP